MCCRSADAGVQKVLVNKGIIPWLLIKVQKELGLSFVNTSDPEEVSCSFTYFDYRAYLSFALAVECFPSSATLYDHRHCTGAAAVYDDKQV